MRATFVVCTLLATLAAVPARGEEITSTVTPTAQTSSTSFRLKRILLETAGAAVGEAAFLYASYVALNAAGAFNEATRPGFPRWGINLGVPLATGLGATLGVIAGARLLEREPPLVAALLGGVFGAAWLSGAMFAQSTSPGSLPDGYQSLAGLLPAACAVIGVELAFGERMTSQNVTVALAPLIFRGRSSGLSVAGRF